MQCTSIVWPPCCFFIRRNFMRGRGKKLFCRSPCCHSRSVSLGIVVQTSFLFSCCLNSSLGIWSKMIRQANHLQAYVYIGHFWKYHNTLCLSPQILHKHCFQFLLGFTMVPRENKNNAYAKFRGTDKEYYGIFRTGLLVQWAIFELCKDEKTQSRSRLRGQICIFLCLFSNS